jgi:hypothetical protein
VRTANGAGPHRFSQDGRPRRFLAGPEAFPA